MPARSPLPRLDDIRDAIAAIEEDVRGLALQDFVADRRIRWSVERGIEIITEFPGGRGGHGRRASGGDQRDQRRAAAAGGESDGTTSDAGAGVGGIRERIAYVSFMRCLLC